MIPTSFPRQVAAYLAASFFMGLANAIFDNVFNFYLAERGISAAKAGNIYAIATLVMALTVIPMLIANRYMSKNKLLLIAAVTYAAPYFALPFVSDVVSATIALSLVLGGMLMLLSVGNAIAGGLVAPADRPRLFGAFFVSYLGAGIIGSLLVAVTIGSTTTGAPALSHYKTLLLVAAGSAAVMFFCRLLSLNPMRATVSATGSAADSAPERPQLNTSEKRRLLTLFGAALLLGASMALVFRFANILFMQAYALPVSEISIILALDKAVSIAGAIVIPLLVVRSSARKTAIILGILVFLSLATQTATIPLSLFVALYLFRLLLNYGQMPLLDAGALEGFRDRVTLLSTGVRQSAFYLGGAGSAAVYGQLLDHGNWQGALLVAAVTALAGSLLLGMLQHQTVRDQIVEEGQVR